MAATAGSTGVFLFDGFTLKKLVDTNTPIPLGVGQFTGFLDPALDNGVVAFLGFGIDDQLGLYRYDNGQLTRVVDRSIKVPGQEQTFWFIGRPWISGASVVFSGGAVVGAEGIYLDQSRSLSVVVDTSVILPFAGKSSGFLDPSIDGTSIVFTTGRPLGIYRKVGSSYFVIANGATRVPTN